MSKGYILTIDQSTSGTKALLVDETGTIIVKKSMNHKQIFPKSGWVEHDPNEIYENVKQLINNIVLENAPIVNEIKVLTITNQRETAVVWNKVTGEPVHNAVVWQCRRTTDMCEKLQDSNEIVRSKTGLKIDPYFSASKVSWILENVEGAREKASNGDLLFGTIDSWLIWKLTNGTVHATDVTNASRTLLLNIHDVLWDNELLEIFNVPASMLPIVKNSDEEFGVILDSEIQLKNIPISGVIGDSQAALFGQGCFFEGMAKATFGTGTSVMVYTGEQKDAKDGLVTSVAWGAEGKVHYALEGIINTTGDIIKWMKEDLMLFSSFEELESLARELPDNDGVYLVPAFVGLGAPYWSPNTRAGIVGMSRNSNRTHIMRAGLESIVYQVKDIISIIEEKNHIHLSELKVDGGATSNNFLMKFLADMLQTEVSVSEIAELSALGSSYLGGLGVGVFNSIEEISQLNKNATLFSPDMDEEQRNNNYEGWKKAVHSLLV